MKPIFYVLAWTTIVNTMGWKVLSKISGKIVTIHFFKWCFQNAVFAQFATKPVWWGLFGCLFKCCENNFGVLVHTNMLHFLLYNVAVHWTLLWFWYINLLYYLQASILETEGFGTGLIYDVWKVNFQLKLLIFKVFDLCSNNMAHSGVKSSAWHFLFALM